MSKEKQTKYGSICEIRKKHKIIDIVKERDIKELKNWKKNIQRNRISKKEPIDFRNEKEMYNIMNLRRLKNGLDTAEEKISRFKTNP